MTEPQQIAIIKTGTANLASVAAAFNRLQVNSRIIETPDELSDEDLLVLPGVGSFQTGMSALRRNGWNGVLQQRFAEDSPTLAICLGLQLLCEGSMENPGVEGANLLPIVARRLPVNVSVPQFGWNRVQSTSDFFDNGYAFYANSYCLSDADKLTQKGWEIATSQYGIEFVAAARRGSFLACQFHPELSGTYGQNLLRNWLQKASMKVSTSASDTEFLPC